MPMIGNKSALAGSLSAGNSQFSQTPALVVGNTDDQLLERYLSLSENQRKLEFLDTAAAAALAGVSRRTIQYWAEIGEIESVFIGRKRWISAQWLRAYLKRRANEHS